MIKAFSHRALILVVCLVAAVWNAGCLTMERSILVNKDLTGRAALKMTIDFDALVPMIIKMEHQSEGKTDPPSDIEIAAAKAQLKAMLTSMPPNSPFDAKRISAGLPEGMTLVESTQKLDGSNFVINLVIGFQDVTKVPLISMPSLDQAPAGVDTSTMKLFQDIEVTDEGGTLLIATKPTAAGGAPTAFQTPISSADLMSTLANTTGMKPEDLTPLVNEMMKGMKVSTRIESPLTVVDTNATTKDGAALIWSLSFEGGLDTLLAADPKSLAVSVRFKK